MSLRCRGIDADQHIVSSSCACLFCRSCKTRAFVGDLDATDDDLSAYADAPHARSGSLALKCVRLFDLLSRVPAQNVNPIYNLLPDILSSLSAEADLPPEQFQVPPLPAALPPPPRTFAKLILHPCLPVKTGLLDLRLTCLH